MKPDQARVQSLITDTITLLCQNGLNICNFLRIQGVIGITVDETDVFLVHINKAIDVADGKLSQDTLSNIAENQLTESCSNRSNGTEDAVCEPNEYETNMEDQASEREEASCLHRIGSEFAHSSGSVDGQQTTNGLKLEPEDDDDVVFIQSEDMPQESLVDYQTANARPKRRHWRHQVRNPQECDQSFFTDILQMDHDVKPGSLTYTGDFSANSYITSDYHNEADDLEMESKPAIDSSQWLCTYYRNATHTSSPSARGAARKHYAQSQLRQKTAGSALRMASVPNPQTRTGQIPSDSWGTTTITKFLCKMCGSSFNHRPSLLAHQIHKHGRQKNKRGRPPTRILGDDA